MRSVGHKLPSIQRMMTLRSYSNQRLSFVPKKKSVLTRFVLVRRSSSKPMDKQTPAASQSKSEYVADVVSDIYATNATNALFTEMQKAEQAANHEKKGVENERPQKDNVEKTSDSGEQAKAGEEAGEESGGSEFDIEDFLGD
ncbi:hypothetical protein QTJ16_003126 [Diplocarpon rosae]|uniref:Uncharacterized protein n=1 Tax=Diplocarpon rosae TaxID=946125 RepID=A0AAD9T0M4_9HELO|nr:hypothetical protein QTJ16_003126 [Diplocarpon rosae]